MPRTASIHCGSSPVTRSTRSSPRTTRVARAIAGAAGDAPREVHLLGRERRLADCRRQRTRPDLRRADHPPRIAPARSPGGGRGDRGRRDVILRMLNGVPLVLASASPRRAQLLRQAGYAFTVAPRRPRRDAARRRGAGRLRAPPGRSQGGGSGAPTARTRWCWAPTPRWSVDGDILGKPADAAEAAAMLARLQGRAHDVLTGVAVVGPAGLDSAVAATRVWFSPMSSGRHRRLRRLGGADGQGRRLRHPGPGLALSSTRIEGSQPNVVGLPVALVHALLGRYRRGRSARRRRLTPEVERHILWACGCSRIVCGSH